MLRDCQQKICISEAIPFSKLTWYSGIPWVEILLGVHLIVSYIAFSEIVLGCLFALFLFDVIKIRKNEMK